MSDSVLPNAARQRQGRGRCCRRAECFQLPFGSAGVPRQRQACLQCSVRVSGSTRRRRRRRRAATRRPLRTRQEVSPGSRGRVRPFGISALVCGANWKVLDRYVRGQFEFDMAAVGKQISRLEHDVNSVSFNVNHLAKKVENLLQDNGHPTADDLMEI